MPHHGAASVKEIPYQVRDDENNSSPMGLCRAKRLSIVLREVVRWGTDLPAASSVVMPHHDAASKISKQVVLKIKILNTLAPLDSAEHKLPVDVCARGGAG